MKNLRTLIEQIMAGHVQHLVRTAGGEHALACTCGGWSKVTTSETLVVVGHEHQAHRVDAVLAALDGRIVVPQQAEDFYGSVTYHDVPVLRPGTIVRIPGPDVLYRVDRGLKTFGAQATLTFTTVDGLDWTADRTVESEGS